MRGRYFLPGMLMTALAASHLMAQSAPELKTRAQVPSQNQSPYANRLGGTVRLRLETRLQSNNLKIGDPVEAKLQQDIKVEGETIVPRNARFKGHVVELMSRDAGDPVTRLAFLFDRAVSGSSDLPLYGTLAGVLVPHSAHEQEVSELQITKLRHMETEVQSGGPVSGETSEAVGQLYRTTATSQPTQASMQWSCREGAGALWCGPANHSLLSTPTAVIGLPGVLFEAENTPQGPIGVLVSGAKKIELNRGVDLWVRLVPLGSGPSSP